jgi:hypothetical protein
MNLHRQSRSERASLIREALRREGGGVWDLREKLQGNWGAPKTANECIRQAVTATRDLLSEFPFPSPPDIHYMGMKSLRMASDHRVDDGVIMLEASFLTKSGVRNHTQIPVLVRQGQVLQPSVFLVEGTAKVISPSAVDDLLKQGTFSHPSMPRTPFGAPLSPAESNDWRQTKKDVGPVPRVNPGMFSTASKRVALRGGAASIEHRTAEQIYFGEFTERMQDRGYRGSKELWNALASGDLNPRGFDPAEVAEARNMVEGVDMVDDANPASNDEPLWDRDARRTAGLPNNLPPARGDLRLQATPATRVGDRVMTTVKWDPDQVSGMSDGNVLNMVRSFVLELGTKKEWRDWGTIADVQIDYFDRDLGEADVTFKSSEISAPQLAGADLRMAALGPDRSEDDATDLDPAEREDIDQNLHVGDEVKLTEAFPSRSRGGKTYDLPKGSKGHVVKDVFGDGVHLEVQFHDEVRTVVPAEMLKRASQRQAQTVPQVLNEIESLRSCGYSPVDVILTMRQRYGSLGDQALSQARKQKMLDW